MEWAANEMGKTTKKQVDGVVGIPTFLILLWIMIL